MSESPISKELKDIFDKQNDKEELTFIGEGTSKNVEYTIYSDMKIPCIKKKDIKK